eukprot:403361717
MINQVDENNQSGKLFAEKAARSIFKEIVAKKYVALLELLINKGADVNQFSFSVFYLANEFKFPEALQVLAQNNAVDQTMKNRVMIIPITKSENQMIAERVLGYHNECLLSLEYKAIQSQWLQIKTGAKQQMATRRGLTTIIIQVKCGLIIRLLIEKGLDINQTTKTNQFLIIMMTKELTNDPQRFINLYQELTKYKELDKNAVDENGNNAFLLAFQNNSMIIAQFLLDEGFNLDFQNKQLKTALILGVQRNDVYFVQTLLQKGCNPNFADEQGKTALHYAVQRKDLQTVKMLLEKKCNPNLIDNEGKTVLHYSVQSNDFNFVEILLDNGCNLNIADKKGRTALHYAVNNSSAGLEANYDIENILIQSGANVNTQDKSGRTPLHYAFVKIGRGNLDRSAMDPIETVSSLCSNKEANPKIQDKYGKNVLHYAAQRGATISTMFLQKKGVDLHHKDIFGNTPLATALLYNHTCNLNLLQFTILEYAIKLISDGSDVKQLVHQETKEVYDEFKKKRAQETMIDVQDDGYESDSSYLKANPLLIANQNNTQNRSLFGHQIQLGNQILFGGQQIQANINQAVQIQEPQTMFKLAVDSGQLGLLYLILDNGFDLFQAIEVSLKKRQFQFVLTLLSKVSDNSIILKINSKGQNLFHILAQNSSSINTEGQKLILTRIYNQFRRRGLNTQRQDNFGRTPLHYAAHYGGYYLVKELVQDIDADINSKDNKGFTPLILALRGNRLFHKNNFEVFKTLIEEGVDCNQYYYDYMYKNEAVTIKNQQDLMDVDMIDTTQTIQQNGEYKVTPFIHFIKQFETINESQRKDYLNFFFASPCNQDLFGKDSNGQNAFGILIQKNQIASFYEIFKIWETIHCNNQSKLMIKNDSDSQGRNPVHLLFTSYQFGIYDNLEFFNFLVEKGFAFDLVDKFQKRPVDYASQYKNSRIYEKLIKLGQSITLQEEQKQNSQLDVDMICTDQKVNIEKDAKEFLDKNKDKLQLKGERKLLVPDAILGEQAKFLEVVCEDPNNIDTAYQAHLLKIDIRKDGQSSQVFYKIQLNFDSSKKIYILLTRWGMIGEQGACQKTPFNNIEEAVGEFKKIFKDKTSNNWEERENFEIPQAKNKYILYKKQQFDVSYTDLLRPFKYSECKKSNLNEQAQTFMKLIANIGIYNEVLRLQQFPISQINLTYISKDKLEEANRIFKELVQIFSLQMSLQNPYFEDKQKQIVSLTCQFYQIFPMFNGNQEYPRPIYLEQLCQLTTKFKELSKLERISKMFKGAYNVQDTSNPLDYIYKALNIQIDFIQKESQEYQVISTYLKNTGPNVFQRHVISNIFNIKRKKDDEIFNQNGYNNDPHKLLLLHGTSLENLMGILDHGFQVSPINGQPQQKADFGQGVCFSNVLEKCIQQAKPTNLSQYHQESQIDDETLKMNRRYIIVCEVAMGKIFKQEKSIVKSMSPEILSYSTRQPFCIHQMGYYALGTQKQLKEVLRDVYNTSLQQEELEDINMQSDYEDESNEEDEENKQMEDLDSNEVMQSTVKTNEPKVEHIYEDQVKRFQNGKLVLGKNVDITRTLRGHNMMQLQNQQKIQSFDTIWVSGVYVPDPQLNVYLKDGSIVPNGKPIIAQERNKNHRVNVKLDQYKLYSQQQIQTSNQFSISKFDEVNQSEFIVKNPKRIRIRYIVEIRELTQTELRNPNTNLNLNINDDEEI